MQMMLPRPGKALRSVLFGLLGIWLFSAIAINWIGGFEPFFFYLTGNTEAIARGEVWRLLTASFLHVPSGTIGHIFSSLLGLFFLAPSLEEAWGSRRFLRFLLLTSVLSYATQFALTWFLGTTALSRLAPAHYFGALPAVEAVAIAWACSFRGRTVNLFFVLPISSRGLILFVVGMSLMYLIAGALPPSGHIALFAGMGWGYLLGGGSPSPLRRFYLRYRLARLEGEARQEAEKRKERVKSGGLRVIEGGKDSKKNDKRMLH